MSVYLDHLTDRQKEVYQFIRDSIRTRGYPPTVREIGARFDISSHNGVMCHLKALEKKGLIVREKNMSRAIILVGERDGEAAELRETIAELCRRVKAVDPRWHSSSRKALHGQIDIVAWKKLENMVDELQVAT